MPVDMKKRRILLLISLVIPAILLLILVLGPWDVPGGGKSAVSLKNMEQVDRIVLADSYNTVELNGADSSWYLSGSEGVSPVAVENLLYTASRLEVASIVGLEEFDKLTDSQEDIREIAFFRGDKVLLGFKARTVNKRFLVNPIGSEKAFYVSLPGYPGLDLDRVFSATPDHYREHLLIDLRPSEIQAIEIELASGESFCFSQDQEGHISCEAKNASTILPASEPNELATRLLFSYFTSIRYERLAGISSDSISGAAKLIQKLAAIRVSSFDGEQHSLQVFSHGTEPGSKPDLFRALVLYNDKQEALFVNYIYLDVLMRGLSHYFGEK